jgi:hypothetical protein
LCPGIDIYIEGVGQPDSGLSPGNEVTCMGMADSRQDGDPITTVWQVTDLGQPQARRWIGPSDQLWTGQVHGGTPCSESSYHDAIKQSLCASTRLGLGTWQ